MSDHEFVWKFVDGIVEGLQLCRWKEDILEPQLMSFDNVEMVVNPIHRHSVARRIQSKINNFL